jgi:phosphatidylserine/phosphatidylglycerophosphate/cardiolipin synthase-like enzyme
MDLAVDRWDDNHHNRAVTEARGRNHGWHDIQVVVQGPAVLQLWANFEERWKDVRSRNPKLLPCPVPAWDWKTWPNHPKMGNKHVQILRTIAPASAGNPLRFMTNGERSVLCGFKKAIEKAECYIYIEEQFLWDCELADLIGARMQANQNLRLIIVMTAGCELPWVAGEHAFHLRSEFFRKVMRVPTKWDIAFGATSRVYPYGLFQANDGLGKAIYVHSKLIIIDDRYVAIGSANVDERSMHIETELTVGIVDGDTRQSVLGGTNTTVCKFAMDLREKLWKEHLGLKSPGVTLPADPVLALHNNFPGINRNQPDAWPTTQDDAIRAQKHHLRCYINIHGNHLALAAGRQILDRNVRKYKPISGP